MDKDKCPKCGWVVDYSCGCPDGKPTFPLVSHMMDTLGSDFVQADGCFLTKGLSVSSLRYEIDTSNIPVENSDPVCTTTEYFAYSKALRGYGKPALSTDWCIKFPENGTDQQKHEWYIKRMLSSTYSKFQKGDRIFWFSKMGALSGGTGYAWFKGQYLYSAWSVIRS